MFLSSFFPFLLCWCTPDVFVRSRWKTHVRAESPNPEHLQCRNPATRGQRSSPCVVWMVTLSSPLILPKSPAHPSADWRLAKIIYLSLSLYIPPHVHTHMYALKNTQWPHWRVPDCRRDTIYERPPGCTLFVCLHLWLRFGGLHSPHSHPIHAAKVQIQLYMLLYLELSWVNTKQIWIFWFHASGGNRILHLYLVR